MTALLLYNGKGHSTPFLKITKTGLKYKISKHKVSLGQRMQDYLESIAVDNVKKRVGKL